MSEGTRAVVWISHKAARCDAGTIELAQRELIAMDRANGIRCLKCTRLDGLVFLPLSARSAVVRKFSRARGRNERQGVLVDDGGYDRTSVSWIDSVVIS
jgi:hypothetical protein